MAVPLFWEKTKAVSFVEMAELIRQISPRNVHHSPEMLIGIFWEETFFCNRKQASKDGGDGGPGVGFGQIQPADAINLIPDVVPHNEKAAEAKILANPDFSVLCTSEELRHYCEDKDKHFPPPYALKNYAGPGNEDKVTMWRKCEAALHRTKVRTRDSVRAALNSCKAVDASFVDFWDFILDGCPEPRLADVPHTAIRGDPVDPATSRQPGTGRSAENVHLRSAE
jgi:hypothetical protein